MINHKKLPALLMSFVIAASLAACGRPGSESLSSDAASSSADSSASSSETAASSEASGASDSSAAAEESAKTPEDDSSRAAAEESANTAAEAEARQRELTAFSCYLDILRLNEEMIGCYDWQDLQVGEEGLVKKDAPSAVAFMDVYGDELPELLFMRADVGANGLHDTASLVIYTMGDQNAILLYDDYLDINVAGGTCYSLFTTNDGELWAYSSIGDEGYSYYYKQLVLEGDHFESHTHLYASFYPNPDYSSFIGEYQIEDDQVSEELYLEEKEKIYAKVDTILMSSCCDDETLAKDEAESGKTAMTYEEGISYLKLPLEEKGFERETLDAAEFFGAMESRDFYFASGAGGWGTELTINDDGSFSGHFHDSDMGTTGEGYPYGTVYESTFSGRFDKVRMIDEDTYACGLAELTLEKPAGEEEIVDEIKYVSSAPYGLDGGENFVIFMPHTTTRDLPESALSWFTAPRALGQEDLPELLNCYGIYNLEKQTCFFSYEG